VEPLKKKHLTRPEAAAYVGYAVQTLANKHVNGSGPPCRRVSGGARGGHVLYDIEDLDLWVKTNGAHCQSAISDQRRERPLKLQRAA